MEIKKINDLTYAFHFDTDIQMKTLFRYLYKSSEKYCYDEKLDCHYCILGENCHEYWELIDALSEIAGEKQGQRSD